LTITLGERLGTLADVGGVKLVLGADDLDTAQAAV
jgi:hypothetical protein